MATYPLAFPNKAPNSETLRFRNKQANMESPFTLVQQTVSGADQIDLEFTWPRMTHADADRIQAWLDALSGQEGTFYYYPRNAVRYDLSGRTLANTAYPLSNTVLVGGWAANAASGLVIGNYVQIGQRLHRIVAAPLTADANGRCLIEVRGRIRTEMASGTAVNFNNPRGIFRLASSDGYAYTLDVDKKPSFPTIIAKEAL